MLRVLPFVLELALLIFCLTDCLQADPLRVRNLPKWAWVLVILVAPLLGALAWLFFGRPDGLAFTGGASGRGAAGRGGPRGGAPAIRGPEDDPAFLDRLARERARQLREAAAAKAQEEQAGAAGPAGPGGVSGPADPSADAGPDEQPRPGAPA